MKIDVAKPRIFEVKEAKAIQKKLIPPRFEKGFNNLIRFFIFFFSSYFGDKEKIFLFFNLDKSFKLNLIFFLLSKDRVISSSFNEEIRAK